MLIISLLVFLARMAIVDHIWMKRVNAVFDGLLDCGYSGNLDADLERIDNEFDSVPSVTYMFFDIRKWTYKQFFGEGK